MVLDSPNMMHSAWANGDRTAASSSVGSINMLDPDDSSSNSDDGEPMEGDDNDDPMLMTPQAMKQNTPFGGPLGNNQGTWSNMFSPGGVPTFMSIQRARLRKGRSRKSSSSASAHSSMGMVSPVPASPPNGKEGYFAREAVIRKAGSRRESLSLFTNDLHISSGNDSGDEGVAMPQTPGVVRRPVTRRGNLLPKSRQFGRIKAELLEESAPIDNEFRREAEIIRQVRENDGDIEFPSATAQSSPSLLPTVPGLDGPLEGVPEEESESNMSLDGSATKGLFAALAPPKNMNPGGRNFWNRDPPAQTPPPPSFPRAGSSAMSEDANMDSPSTSASLPCTTAKAGGSEQYTSYSFMSRSSTPQPLVPLSAADGLKRSSKRRRDDDLDGYSIKRRAVSPGVSVHNSPVLSQSPAQRDGSVWGRSQREPSVSGGGGHASGERSNSGGSVALTPSLGPKRVGLQSMTDTHDGLMKMSIETAALSSFVESAPPGELTDVTKAIKSILGDDAVESELAPAYQKYHEEQFSTTKLPGGSAEVLVSPYNSLGDGRYYDAESSSSFAFDRATGKASDVESYVLESGHDDLVKSLVKSLSTHASEHYPKSSIGVYPTEDDTQLAILTVANKYSPSNYWNGRWRSSYIYNPSSNKLTGAINVDVHYYEDGNVRLLTKKDVSLSVSGGSAAEVVRQIAGAEKKYQEDLNKAFASLSEGAFKQLRRQLPITRQKIEWEKISGYRLGQDIGGGRSR
ncbi:subunits of heterodimeric actin filament capping protein Capz [Byssothecium circinans]|uniref:F-actin-capping protein subunit alpha n=1 Tax=Byssothecium circinans TaxID=147558 RepID=A0A6A5TKH0_9PLEO|nr:subunits of heterodimeric actin filament capping protein Capz [Byssothecium circinans]